MDFDSEPTDGLLARFIMKDKVDREDRAGRQRRRRTEPEADNSLPDSGQLERHVGRFARSKLDRACSFELPGDDLRGRWAISAGVPGHATAIQRLPVAKGVAVTDDGRPP